jgi:hypothetical protein
MVRTGTGAARAADVRMVVMTGPLDGQAGAGQALAREAQGAADRVGRLRGVAAGQRGQHRVQAATAGQPTDGLPMAGASSRFQDAVLVGGLLTGAPIGLHRRRRGQYCAASARPGDSTSRSW